MTKLALIGVGGCVLIVVIKQVKPEFATIVLLSLCILMTGYLTSDLKVLMDFVRELSRQTKISATYITLLFKLLAIAYVSQVASSLCEDMGYGTISFQIEVIGKVTILMLSIPIIRALLETMDRYL